jgi:RNA polymerase sigma factor (sigma-70 family)
MPVKTIDGQNRETLNREFESLFWWHHKLMYRAAYSVAGNAYDADDAVQTVFLRLIRQGIPAFNHNPEGYFFRAAIHEALHIVRIRGRHSIRDEDAFPSEPSTDASPLEDDLREKLLDALAKLDDRDVELLVLSYQDGYTNAEIAKILDRTRGVIAVSLHRARARLKKWMSVDTGGQQ